MRDFAEFVEASNYLDGEPPACFRLPPGDASNPVFDATWRDPGFAQGGDHPVIGVSYEDALAFCGWLTGRERATGAIRPDQEYRLPTDAEWTLAADFHGPYPWGNALPPGEGAGNFGDVAYAKTYRKSRLAPYDDGFAETAPATAFAPNRFGLHHMAGNVWEWTGAPDAEGKIAFRGASWSNDHLGGYGYQLSNRWNSLRAHDIGFRIVLASAKASAEGR
ncbi:MAG: SUMF1/EgtB/PvdO family nonheme iron enzyme [Verrucomicrobiales bacterium]